MKITSNNHQVMQLPKLTGNHSDLGHQVQLDTAISVMAYVTAEEAERLSIAWAGIAAELRQTERAAA